MEVLLTLPINHYQTLAVDTAREAGLFLRQHLSKTHQVEFKGEINLVTEADRMSENMIVSRIRQVCPEHSILMEESPR